MSKREGTFCDFVYDLDNRLCSIQAIGTCVFCEQDVCSAHAVHETTGLLVQVDIRELVVPQGVNQQPQTSRMINNSQTAVVCRVCANHIRSGRHTDMSKVSAAARDAAIKAIRAALAKSALSSG